MNKPATRKLRCAVYTRKSSEEGLDQEFNSLDAQREAGGKGTVLARHGMPVDEEGLEAVSYETPLAFGTDKGLEGRLPFQSGDLP